MGPEDLKLLRETHRLVEENNKLLRKMRRSALVHTIVWFIIYAAIIAAPIWFYVTYLDGAMQKVLETYDSLQGGGSQVSQQYEGLQDAIGDLRARLTGATSSDSSQ